MQVNSTLRRLLFVIVFSALWTGSSFSADTPFYRGKTLTVLINFAAGGPRIAKVAPKTPPEAGTALRQGFSQMIKDPEFIQEFKKVTRSEPNFQVGGEAVKLISKLGQASPEVRSTIRKYTESK